MGCGGSTAAKEEPHPQQQQQGRARQVKDVKSQPEKSTEGAGAAVGRATAYERPEVEFFLLDPSQGHAPSARKMHTAIAVADHSLIIFGGVSRSEEHDETENLEASMNLEKVTLNRQTFRVSLKPPRVAVWNNIVLSGDAPSARATHKAVTMEGSMYVYGQQSKQDSELYVYNMAFNQWRKLKVTGQRPRPLSGASLTLASRALIVFGGEGDRGISNELHAFSLDANNWIQIEAKGPLLEGATTVNEQRKFLLPRRDHSALAVNERLLIYGGFGIESEKLEFIEFSALTKQWKKVPEIGELPKKRGGHCATMYEVYMVVFGGMRHGRYLNDLNVFHTITGAWTPVSIVHTPGCFIPSPRAFAAASMVNDQWYVHGGGDERLIFADFFKMNVRTIARCADPSLPRDAERQAVLCSAAWDILALPAS